MQAGKLTSSLLSTAHLSAVGSSMCRQEPAGTCSATTASAAAPAEPLAKVGSLLLLLLLEEAASEPAAAVAGCRRPLEAAPCSDRQLLRALPHALGIGLFAASPCCTPPPRSLLPAVAAVWAGPAERGDMSAAICCTHCQVPGEIGDPPSLLPPKLLRLPGAPGNACRGFKSGGKQQACKSETCLAREAESVRKDSP